MLDPETKELIKEAFMGEVCHICGGQAERYVFKKMWCGPCLPEGKWKRKSTPYEIPKTRVANMRYKNRRRDR